MQSSGNANHKTPAVDSLSDVARNCRRSNDGGGAATEQLLRYQPILMAVLPIGLAEPGEQCDVEYAGLLRSSTWSDTELLKRGAMYG